MAISKDSEAVRSPESDKPPPFLCGQSLHPSHESRFATVRHRSASQVLDSLF